MIKFWKNAAKRRSISPPMLPDRPSSSQDYHGLNSFNSEVKRRYVLAKITEDDLPYTTEKKSKLSMDLLGVLNDKNYLQYFIQYLETASALCLIQFWLDIENFKAKVKTLNSKSKQYNNIENVKAEKNSDAKQNEVELSDCVTSNTSKNVSFNQNSDITRDLKEKIAKEDIISKDCNEFLVKDKSIIDIAVLLFKKYIALEAQNKLDLPDNVRNCIVSNICQPDGKIEEECFDVAQNIVLNQLKNIHFENFLKSPFYTKAQIDILTTSSLTLDDILYDETVLFYFMEYLEQESCLILLEFIIAVTIFNENFTNVDKPKPEIIQNDAITVYEKYLSLQATDSIGFSDDVRLQVEGSICKEGGPCEDCFHKPFRIVYKTLSEVVPYFLESEVFYKYLNEMINSNKKNHKRAMSECSSETSTGTYNTLLAMGGSSYKSNSRNSLPDMTIETKQLIDGDALWKRKRADGLSLGRINSLGQFESKFEPDPDKRKRSVLKKMFDKFTPNSTSEVEEEMAWQVAEMIVKDITDLTLAPSQENC